MRKIVKYSLSLFIMIVMLFGVLAEQSFAATGGPKIRRIEGENRYSTAAAVSRDVYKTVGTVIIALGEDYADALSGGQLSVAAKAPILLARRNSIPEETTAELERLQPKKIYILGGKNALSENVENQLIGFAETERIEGRNRYKTSEAIAKKSKELGMKDDSLIASGKDFPDSLSAGGAVAKNKQSLALSNGQDLPMIDYKSLTLLGGTKALPLPSVSAKRIGGANRYDTALMLAKENFEKPKTIILASGENFPDALTAVSLAAKYDAPILLSRKDILDPNTLTYIQENCEDLIIVGGKAAIDITIPTQEPDVKKSEAIITFVPNFENTPITVKTTVGEKTMAPVINRSGYTLKGWNTKADGTGEMVNLNNKTFSEDTVLYAIWESADTIITFDYNYQGAPRKTTQYINSSSTVTTPNEPVR